MLHFPDAERAYRTRSSFERSIMIRKPMLYFATAAVLSGLVVAPRSFAQTASPSRGLPVDQSRITAYEFDDDPLTAGHPYFPMLRVRERAARETVLRPRTSFVRPLIRAVESIGDPYPPALRVRRAHR